MPDPLPELEVRRSSILLVEIARLSDFLRSSVNTSFRRCGKPNSACASDDHPGHNLKSTCPSSATARPCSTRSPLPPRSARPSAS